MPFLSRLLFSGCAIIGKNTFEFMQVLSPRFCRKHLKRLMIGKILYSALKSIGKTDYFAHNAIGKTDYFAHNAIGKIPLLED